MRRSAAVVVVREQPAFVLKAWRCTMNASPTLRRRLLHPAAKRTACVPHVRRKGQDFAMPAPRSLSNGPVSSRASSPGGAEGALT